MELVKFVIEENFEYFGVYYYIFYVYDFFGLVEKVIMFVNYYGEMIFKVLYVVYMLFYIYMRLGEWEKFIEWNIMLFVSVWEMCVLSGVVNSYYIYVLDYFVYVYL